MELFIAVSMSLLAASLPIVGVALLSRKLMLVRRLRPALYLAALAAGLRIFTLFETAQLAALNQALAWVLMLLGGIAVLQVAGLYFFDVYLHHHRGVRLPPLDQAGEESCPRLHFSFPGPKTRMRNDEALAGTRH